LRRQPRLTEEVPASRRNAVEPRDTRSFTGRYLKSRDMMKIESTEQAKAFALFLAFERKRHLDDIKTIDRKLGIIREKWNIVTDDMEIEDCWVNDEEI